MGQNSSKRRTHSVGRGKNGNTGTLPRTNGDDVNGSIEVHQGHDSSRSEGQEHNTPSSPTSGTSVSPSNTTGKKEKRKRFRVGFSLKRTPSGRWSRKKKTPTQNGARPVSSPDSLKEEQIENSGRPQSLFLEELDIHEEDNKIETVDLSDNEDGKQKHANEDKSAPKVPEKTRWIRGSHKKSSSKKKKKEKQTPKKDKKKKQKTVQDAPEAVASTEVATVTSTENVVANTQVATVTSTAENVVANREVATVTSTAENVVANTEGNSHVTAVTFMEKAAPKTEETDHVQIAIATSTEKVVANTEEASHVLVTAATLTEKALAISEAADNVYAAAATSTEIERKDVTTINEHVTDLSMSDGQPEIDIKAVAVSIVAYTVKTAQERLRAESCHNNASTSSTQYTTDHTSSELGTSAHESKFTESVAVSSDDAAVEVNEDATAIKSETTESATKIAQDIIDEIMDKSGETSPEPSMYMDMRAESQNLVQTVHITNENTSVLTAENNDTKTQLESDNPKQNEEDYSYQTQAEDTVENKYEENANNIMSTHDATRDDMDTTMEIKESEAVAKKTVESVIAAAIQVVHGEKGYNEDSDKKAIHEFKDDFDKSRSDLDKDNVKLGLKEDNVKNNENETEDMKAEEGDKLKEKQKKVEEKSSEKRGKDKSKSEIKIKVPKKFSNWFHKKDRQPKTVGEVVIGSPEGGEAVPLTEAASSRHIAESSQEHVMESIACHTDLVPTEPQPSNLPSKVNDTVTLEISEGPLNMSNSTLTESSPDSNELSSPSASVSPTSPTSDPIEKKTGSGFLKKIFLGPRLRTAIHRKKSSGPSDEQDKQSLSPTNPPDSTELTPPPRKLRHKKQSKQCSPISPGISSTSSTDTSPQSPLDMGNSTLEFTGQYESSEANMPIDDSGFADLTSPEVDKSDISYSDEFKLDNVDRKAEGAIAKVGKLHTDNSINDKEKTQINTVNENSYNVEDDTCPLPQGSTDETKLDESVVDYQSKDYFLPLDSPTLISTAVIILRSTSTEERVAVPDNMSTEDINPDVARQREDSMAACNTDVSEAVDGICSSASMLPSSPVSFKEHRNSSSTPTTSAIPDLSQSERRCGMPDKQARDLSSYVAHISPKPDVAQTKFENINSQRYFKETASSEGNENQFQRNNPGVWTIAEYQIGVTHKEDDTQTRTHKECINDFFERPQQSNNVKDKEQLAAESHLRYCEPEADGTLFTNTAKVGQLFGLDFLEDSSQVEQKTVVQKEHNAELRPQNVGNTEQTDATASLKVKSDGLKFPQITDYTDEVNGTSSSKENGHEYIFTGEEVIVEDCKQDGVYSFQESRIQAGGDINDRWVNNLDDLKNQDDTEKAESTVTSMAYIMLQRWDISNGDVQNRYTSTEPESES